MKKLISGALALAMAFGAVAPTITLANEVKEENEVAVEEKLEVSEKKVGINGIIDDAEEETAVLEIAEYDEFKRQLQGYRDEVDHLETHNETQEKMKAEFDEKTLEIEGNIDKMSVGAVGFADIYDLQSIPQRLMLVGRLGVAIRFATTELRYKVDAAHTEIAEYIFQGLVIAASPFHTIEDMKTHMAEFEVLKQKLLGYPDIGLHDAANLYVRSDLDTLLHKARFAKYNDLKDKSTDVIKDLDREIARITNERLKPQRTVAEIYQLTDELNQAMMIAINSQDFRAKNYEIEEVKRLRAEARRAKRHGDRRMELAEAIDRTNEEMLKTRPSQPVLRDLIANFNALLYNHK
ncbi:CAMP factor family pore-forming toxin [Lagierella sp.]|uniref:CAMP factor family pore-forming toxin n=1 Tax=Lagierella sp. TaxID=2849657 RepID=UPI0026213B6C|nr:CAMP factor family pore-forming toxin [Lagierella sp.]